MDQHKPPPQPKYLSQEESVILIQDMFAQLERGGVEVDFTKRRKNSLSFG